jgi:hypothetical protein
VKLHLIATPKVEEKFTLALVIGDNREYMPDWGSFSSIEKAKEFLETTAAEGHLCDLEASIGYFVSETKRPGCLGYFPILAPYFGDDWKDKSYYDHMADAKVEVYKGNNIERRLLKSKNIDKIMDYVFSTGKNRWPEAEPIIIKTHEAIEYASEVIKGRWPELESYLLSSDSAHEILAYALHIFKGRWPEAEPIVLRDYSASYHYAINIIKDRWPEAEPLLLKEGSSHTLATYARVCVKGRWPEAESIIQKDPNEWFKYLQFLSDPTPEGWDREPNKRYLKDIGINPVYLDIKPIPGKWNTPRGYD